MDKNLIDTEPLLNHLENSERKVVKMIAKQQTLPEIAGKMGLPEKAIEKIILKARFAFGANDDLIDDYLHLLDQWGRETGISSISGPIEDDDLVAERVSDQFSSTKQRVFAELEAELSTAELRDVAGSLLKLADSIDQNWKPEQVRSEYTWLSYASKIERNSLELAKKAQRIIRASHSREKLLPPELFGEPAWNILLDLFIQFSGGAKVSGKSLCIASGAPATTALRHLARLEELQLVQRHASQGDKRVVLYSLTKHGVVGVGRILEQFHVS